ncbi:MAG: sigma-70 family RNA polymerase sigma factor [Bdellovibrionales bacterium]|nr:sigma-70 family RNA polymerase sigma factor [Bdellovibrionales bacterium]
MKITICSILALWGWSLGACPETIAGAASEPLLKGGQLNQQALYQAMLRARAGDRAAQNDVLSALSKVVPRQIRARMRMTPERLDDVVQDVLFRVVRRNFDFDPSIASYQTWMYWYIRGCARIPKHQMVNISGSEFGEDEPDFFAAVPDTRETESLEQTEEKRLANTALGLLNQMDQHIITEVLLKGGRQNAVAESLGISRYVLGQRLARAQERLQDRVAKLQVQRLRPVLTRAEFIPAKSHDLFVAVSLDNDPLNLDMCNEHGFTAFKECARAYFVAVGSMAHTLKPEEFEGFWNAVLELPGPYRSVETEIVNRYLSSGEFPGETTLTAVADAFSITVDRVIGIRVANPQSGPTSMRIFWGKDHLLWMFHRFLQRAEDNLESPSELQWQRLHHFDPTRWGRPQSPTPYRPLARNVFTERLSITQRTVIEKAVKYFRSEGRLPHPREELPQVCGFSAVQLFSYGKDYQPGERWEGFGVFKSIEEYETLLEAHRVMLLKNTSSPDETTLLEALGKAHFTRLEYQSRLSSVFAYQYPVISKYFTVLTPLEQRVFLLRAEQALPPTALAAQLGLSLDKVHSLSISGLARIEKKLRLEGNEKALQDFAKELLDLPGPHRETALHLAEGFAKSGRFPTEETVLGMLEQTYGLSAKHLIGVVGSKLSSEKLNIRLFYGIHHFQWSVLECMARERKKLESREPLNARSRGRLLRLRRWTIHQMEIARHVDPYTPLLLEFYSLDRDRELERLLDLAIDNYLTNGTLPNASSLIELTGIHRDRLFGGNRPRADETVRKFYFDNREHFEALLEKRRQERLQAPDISADHTEALLRMAILASNQSEEGTACEVPLWLREAFATLPAAHQRAICLRAIHELSQKAAASALDMEAASFTELYLSAITLLARHFERADSTESLELFLEWALEQPGPQREFSNQFVDSFGDDPTFVPTPESLQNRLDWDSVSFAPEQLLGTGLYGPKKRLARVFFGPHHAMWAYERTRAKRAANDDAAARPSATDPTFRPLESNWVRNNMNVYSSLFEARMDPYRTEARERALAIAVRVSPCPASAGAVAETMGISVEQLVGGKEYNRARPKGYLRIFDGQKNYDEVMSRACSRSNG